MADEIATSVTAESPVARPARAAPPVPGRWRNLAAITGVEVVDSAEAGLVNTLFPSIAAALRLDSEHLGLLAAVGKLVSVPFAPGWVWLAGRIGRKAAMIGTTVTGGMCGVLAGFADGFLALLILNTLMSACLVGGQPIANSVIADCFDDRTRGIATGYFYATITAVSSFLGPVLALFTATDGGWRYAMWTIGGICIVAALVITAFYRDPGVGASEPQLADLAESQRAAPVTVSSVMSVFRVPTYSIMMLSRVLSGHLLISIFGIQFLVTERGFTNATATLVLVPFGIGYVVGTLGGGYVVALLDRAWEHVGRVVFIQLAQIGFALAALFGTQLEHTDITTYAVFWGLLGLFQGMNPPVNRPIVMSVVLPELRGQAFAIFLSVFQTIGWAMFALTAGWLANDVGIQGVFFWILVILMLINALVLSALYLTYPHDARRVADELRHRRAASQ